MINGNTFLIFNLEKIEAEVRDLKKFWDDLSWWERDNSMKAALDLLNLDYTDVPDKLKKMIEEIREEIKNLNDLNVKTRPSKIKLLLSRLLPELLSDGYQKFNFRKCLAITMNLTSEEQIKLYTYLGIENIESLKEDTRNWYNLCWDVGANRTLAIFYALRNYLGKMQQYR
ncbi:MAG: hypothetical protein JXA98_04185 [Methanosarcinaceae archaeon]|nr:hypothetical protein [Methanosarcinaceae archaeon]